MYAIRPVRAEDEEGLLELIANGGTGITTLPHHPELLRLKIQHSIEAFKKQVSTPNDEKYFFVLEDLDSREIGGCCAIYSQSGITESDDYYQILYERPSSLLEHQPEKLEILKLVNYRNGPSMLCSLYLSHKFRKEGLGRLLSLSRFLFIACHPMRFTKTIIANIRGVFDENNHSPFWQGLGRHFLDIDFEALLQMQEVDKEFISHILPKHPIYICLLPIAAQETIGKTHAHSVPAAKMLEGEGFIQTNEIDLFDAGPKLSAEIAEIRCIRSRKYGRIARIGPPAEHMDRWMLSNDKLDFRACYGQVELCGTEMVCINPAVASALNVDIGDNIYYVKESGKS